MDYPEKKYCSGCLSVLKVIIGDRHPSGQGPAEAFPGEVEIVGLPMHVDELRAMAPMEFQNWVVRERFNGSVGPKGGDKGIDGFSFLVHDPIQVKQSDGVGRNVVDKLCFCDATDRQEEGVHRGVLIR